METFSFQSLTHDKRQTKVTDVEVLIKDGRFYFIRFFFFFCGGISTELVFIVVVSYCLLLSSGRNGNVAILIL